MMPETPKTPETEIEIETPEASNPPEIRNLKRNPDRTVDLELNHREFGWIPFTSSPNDSFGSAPEVWAAVLAWDGPIGVAEPVIDPYANFIPVPLLRQRIEALGMWDEFAAYLAQNPAEMLKVLTVTSVDPAYPALGVAFDAMEVPQAYRDAILAPPSAGVTAP